jgi:hypothetical protein
LQPECINGTRDLNLEEERKERASGRIFRKTIELKIAKQTVGNSTRLQKMNVRTLWRGRPPPKRKWRPLTD